MARLYLDEQIDTALTDLLIQYGHDVLHCHDAGNDGAPDTEQLLFAARANRILVTLNREDFEELHRLWLALNSWLELPREHAGILTTWGNIAAVEWAGLIHLFIGDNPEMRNRMWRWNRQSRRWQPYGW